MRLCLLLLMAAGSVQELHGIFDGVCPRKDPPPGVLVLSSGSELFLTCSGHVKVDGVKVSVSGNSSNARQSSPAAVAATQEVRTDGEEAGISAAPGQDGVTDHPHGVHPTSSSREPTGESDWEDEEEEGGGGRVTRGIKSRPQWKWNKTPVGSEDRDWGEFTFGTSGATLTLTSVKPEDSGKYSCHHRGHEFAVKVIVADPLESPTLFCYKRSPSSKIRCEGTPQKSVNKQPQCFLSLSKSRGEDFRPLPCSYSHQHSRCWCSLEHIADDVRTLHTAFLCVTSITGNVTSNLLHFTPLSILKPDPPSNVSTHQKEGQETRIDVTWNPPASWKQKDRYYHLIYELRYRPSMSSFNHQQIVATNYRRSYTITDAMPGVEYQIQLRAKDEFDGEWSNLSSPHYARSWTPTSTMMDDLTTTMYSDSMEGTGSGVEWDADVSPTEADVAVQVSLHFLRIAAVFAFVSVILGIFMFRHKARFMSKLHNLRIIPRRGDSSPPPPLPTTSAPEAPKVRVLMTFAPPVYKERAGSDAEEGEEEENEEGQRKREAIDAVHFNNTSYFLLQRE